MARERGGDGGFQFRRRRIGTLLTHDINLFAYHLPLDAHPGLGNNAQLAQRLGWIAEGRFGEQDIAWHGSVAAPTTAGALAASLAAALGRPPQLIGDIPAAERAALYAAYGLTEADCPEGYIPRMVSTGLADIMMPVRDHETLMRAVQNAPVVTELSRKYDVTGVHMFCPGRDGVTAWCSNYAPLYDIPEECATGTSNGALTYYLYLRGDVKPEQENVFLQGEHMGRPSEIRSMLYEKDGTVTVRIGGSAVMSLDCELKL